MSETCARLHEDGNGASIHDLQGQWIRYAKSYFLATLMRNVHGLSAPMNAELLGWIAI